MKKHSERRPVRNNYFSTGENAKGSRLHRIKAAMLACILLAFLLNCNRDTTFRDAISPNHNALNKVSESSATAALAVPISTSFFGINAWMHPTPNQCVSGGQLPAHWGDVQNSGAKFIRIGGKNYDKCLKWATDFDTFDIQNNIFAQGLIPIAQLSYYNPNTNLVWTDTAAAATHLLNNVVIPLYNKGVRYFSIGNEPNLKYTTQNINGHFQNTAAGIYDYIFAISRAIKGWHSDIILLGPELSYYNESLVRDLTSGQYNILPYIDIFTFHYYPFQDESIPASKKLYWIDPSRDNITNVLRGGASVYSGAAPTRVYYNNPATDTATYFETRLDQLKQILNGTNKKVAITEFNICYQNDGTNSNPFPGTDNLVTGNGARGKLAGQFLAELAAVCMSKGVAFINFWSVIEGSINYLNYSTDIGYISSQTGSFNSTYYHFQMLAKNFNGNFKWGTVTADPAIPQPKIKAFASISPTKITIMVMNQEVGGSIPIKVTLNNTVVVPPGGVNINVSNGIGSTYSDVIAGEQTLLIRYNKSTGVFSSNRY
jgi:hypothetical protein